MSQVEILLELFRSSVLDRDPVIPANAVIDWDRLMDLSVEQNILPWVWNGICRLPLSQCPPRQQRINWGLSAQDSLDCYRRQKIVLAEMIDVCNKNNIKLLLLKGIGLSTLYPDPQLRPSSDIDIFLFDDFEKGNILFGDGVNKFNHKHTSFNYCGVHVENHVTPIDIDTKYQEKVERYIESTLANVIKTEDGFFILPPITNLLYLITHAVRHYELETLIPLRLFIDIALFIQRNEREVNTPECYNILKKMHMEKSLALILTVAEGILKVSLPMNHRNLISGKERTYINNIFLKAQFEKISPYMIDSTSSLRKQWKWYLNSLRLYKFIPKTGKEKYAEFQHQMGFTLKYILGLPMNKTLLHK